VKADVEEAVAADRERLEKTREERHEHATTSDKVWREVVSWFWVIMAFLFIEGTLVQARVIPSGSMENTVLIGDHLIVSRFGYDAGIPFTPWHVPLWREPKRQQITVFRAPLADQGFPDFIKRCIGVPGDRIKIVDGTGICERNGAE
jgi:signal peptidase I